MEMLLESFFLLHATLNPLIQRALGRDIVPLAADFFFAEGVFYRWANAAGGKTGTIVGALALGLSGLNRSPGSQQKDHQGNTHCSSLQKF
jgi:hypothetical protein